MRHDAVRAARWTVSGTTKVLGTVDVDEAALGGLVSVAGAIRAGAAAVRGTLEATATLEVSGALTGEGTLRVRGPTHAGSVDWRGLIHAESDLSVDRDLRVRGTLEAASLRAAVLELEGRWTVPGTTTVIGALTVEFHGDSEVGPIRARTAVLRGQPAGLVPQLWQKVFHGTPVVRVESVEAEAVELEAVEVHFVRAASIVLGPHAHVVNVEGTIVRQHPSARVGPESRSPPPYGLRR